MKYLIALALLLCCSMGWTDENLTFIKYCNHDNIEKKNSLIWCEDCGEVLADTTPKNVLSFRNKFVLDNTTFEYDGIEYKNLKYVIKKINEEIKH